MLTWKRDSSAKPPRYTAQYGEHFYDIEAFQGSTAWTLSHTGPFGDFESAVELGTMRDCKAAAERHVAELPEVVGLNYNREDRTNVADAIAAQWGAVLEAQIAA